MLGNVSNATFAWLVPTCAAVLLAGAGWAGTMFSRWSRRLTGRFDRLSEQIGALEHQMDSRFDQVDNRISRVEDRTDMNSERLVAAETTLGLRSRAIMPWHPGQAQTRREHND